MTWEVAGLLVAALFAALSLIEYRSQLRFDASWERMRRELTPVWHPGTRLEQQLSQSIGWANTSVMIFPRATDHGYTHLVR